MLDNRDVWIGDGGMAAELGPAHLGSAVQQNVTALLKDNGHNNQ
jgi:hypothetical protein